MRVSLVGVGEVSTPAILTRRMARRFTNVSVAGRSRFQLPPSSRGGWRDLDASRQLQELVSTPAILTRRMAPQLIRRHKIRLGFNSRHPHEEDGAS